MPFEFGFPPDKISLHLDAAGRMRIHGETYFNFARVHFPMVTQDHNNPVIVTADTPTTIDWSFKRLDLLPLVIPPSGITRDWTFVAQFCSDTSAKRVRCELYNVTDAVVVTTLETTSALKSNRVFKHIGALPLAKVYCVRAYRVDSPASCVVSKVWLEDCWDYPG